MRLALSQKQAFDNGRKLASSRLKGIDWIQTKHWWLSNVEVTLRDQVHRQCKIEGWVWVADWGWEFVNSWSSRRSRKDKPLKNLASWNHRSWNQKLELVPVDPLVEPRWSWIMTTRFQLRSVQLMSGHPKVPDLRHFLHWLFCPRPGVLLQRTSSPTIKAHLLKNGEIFATLHLIENFLT